ncbi:TetR/AcrR family transcriptional regulator [Companilactobacillus versmoldensis]|uniref:Transcription regulator n=1 Tax=Companilactobacillus versmoldensis DSM 14857 = KCTC 3814 TaxID=1423815 RepID=A0A0R1SCR2_9LACO|nr:TetR/AcrR family transcriptional regulator [Companilactobacillus versmoldensis]KRL66975.1 transcription regulator [Companilactobacillus versmoldensis DSM 14857 = KCTC 3814]
MTIDKRVQRTNQALRSTFRRLAKTNSYNELTVKKLTEEAGVNRKTFYLHYESIDDFLNTFVEELSSALLRIINSEKFEDFKIEPGNIFEKLFDFFEQSREFYTFILMSDEYSFLSRKVESKVAEGFANSIEASYHITSTDAKICASFMIRNTTMLFRMYDRKQVHFTKEEFKDYLVRLNHSGLQTFVR